MGQRRKPLAYEGQRSFLCRLKIGSLQNGIFMTWPDYAIRREDVVVRVETIVQRLLSQDAEIQRAILDDMPPQFAAEYFQAELLRHMVSYELGKPLVTACMRLIDAYINREALPEDIPYSAEDWDAKITALLDEVQAQRQEQKS